MTIRQSSVKYRQGHRQSALRARQGDGGLNVFGLSMWVQGRLGWRIGLILVMLLTACGPGLVESPPAIPPASPTAAAAAPVTNPLPTPVTRESGAPPTTSPVGAPTATALAPTNTARPAGEASASPTAATAVKPPPTRQVATPRGEQTLTLAGGIEAPRTLDPALIQDANASFIARQVFSGLVKLDERLEPVPDLAAALPTVSADRLTYTFQLRPGLSFWDGTPVTAATIKQSFERATDPRLGNGDGSKLPASTYLIDIKGAADRLAGRAGEISGLRVPDPLTLEMTLVAPQATFLLKLTHASATVVDLRQVGRAQWWRQPNATGPFRLTEWRDGDRLVLTRWERYHDGLPPLARVVMLLGANAAQPLNLYEGGKIDLTGVGTDTVDRLLSPASPLNAELRSGPSLSLTYVAFNVKEAPFDDIKVRRALSLAIDRDRVARVMFEGKVQRAHGLVPPGLPAGDLRQPSVDHAAALAEARRLLSESKYGANLPRVRLYVSGDGVAGMLREVYQRDLGLTIDVIAVTWNDYLEGLNQREYPAYVLSWLADYPDPQNFIETLFRSSSPDNRTRYANPQLDALLDQAAREGDPRQRAEFYRQAQRIVLDDAVVIPLYFPTSYLLVKSHVKGLTVTSMGIVGLEQVWIER